MTDPHGLFSTALHGVLVGAGLTPRELASRLGEGERMVLSWLSGRIPKSQNLLRIAKALDIVGNEPQVRRLFSAAVSDLYSRPPYNPENASPEGFARAVHSYFGTSLRSSSAGSREDSDKTGGGLGAIREPLLNLLGSAPNSSIRISDQDHRRLFAIWSSLLSDEAQRYTDSTGLASSALVLLPKPPLVVVTEWKDITRVLAEGRLTMAELGWQQFEDLIGHLLERFGWEVSPMGRTKDNGIDLVAVRKVSPDIHFNMMVQCKRLAPHRKVGIEVVREVWAVKWQRGFNQAMIATTSAFTSGAQLQGAAWNLELRDHDTILNWCNQLGEATALG